MRLATRNHAAFRSLIGSLDDDGARRVVRYRTTSGDEFANTVEDILMHVALHGSYHRGQVARIVRGEGGTPLATDYILRIRGAAPATAVHPDTRKS